MHDAGLQRRRRIDGGQRLAHALETIGHGDQDVPTAARLQVGEDLHPELRAFRLLDPDPEDVARAVRQDGQGQIHGLAADDRFIADLHAQGVKEHYRIHGLERARLPRGDLRDHGVGDGANQIRRDLDAVHLDEKRLDLAHRQPARIERHHLVVEAREAPLVFADQPRLETAVPVARHGEGQRAVIGEDGLATAAIAMIGGVLRLGAAWPVAEMVTQLRA